MEDSIITDAVKIFTPRNQGTKRNNPSPSPNNSPNSGVTDSIKELVAKKNKFDSGSGEDPREEQTIKAVTLTKAVKEFLDEIDPVVNVIKIQEAKMMEPYNLSGGKKGSFNKSDKENKFRRSLSREEDEKKRYARRKNKVRNGYEPTLGDKEASYAGPLNNHDQFDGKIKDNNHYYGRYGKELVPNEIRKEGVTPMVDVDGRLTGKTTRINDPKNPTAMAHRDRFHRGKVVGQVIGWEFLDDVQKAADKHCSEMIKDGVEEQQAKAITKGVVGMLNDAVKPYIMGAAATEETVQDMVISVDKKVDMLNEVVQDHIEVAVTKDELCRMIQSESDRDNTILIKDSKYLDDIYRAITPQNKKGIAIGMVEEMLDYKKGDLDTRMIEYVKTVFPSQNDRKAQNKRGTIEIHFNPKSVKDATAIENLIRNIPEIAWAGQNKNDELARKLKGPLKKDYDDKRLRWAEWKRNVGEVIAYKSIKTKYESKRFFEQVEVAHRNNMDEVNKAGGLRDMEKMDGGEFVQSFPSFLQAKRYNPHGPGPMIQRIFGNSFNAQDDYKNLVMLALERGEAWNKKQEQWSGERMREKEVKFGARTKKKNKPEDNLPEKDVEMTSSK